MAGGPAAPTAYETFYEDGDWKVRDRRGRPWTEQALEDAILMRRGAVESVEPLIKQMQDLPEVMDRFRNPVGGVRAELRRVLDEMSQKNWEITLKAERDEDFGFEASRIEENTSAATVALTNYNLQGIHKLTHEQIGEFFRGDQYYGRGIELLFGSTLGKRALIGFAEIVGLVVLAIFCAPAAIGAGIALAEHEYEKAKDREKIYGALIDPDQVLTYAEVEAGLFAAELGLALSFLPVVGEFVGEARAAFRVVTEEAIEAGSEAAAQAAARQAAAQLARTAEHGFVEKFVEELVKTYAIQKVMETALDPIMASLEREWGTTGPIGGLEHAMAELMRRRAERAAGGSR
jgi:hypothetical protein